jgi:sulfatase modifying factor 1
MYRCKNCYTEFYSSKEPDNCPYCGVYFSGIEHVYTPRTPQYQSFSNSMNKIGIWMWRIFGIILLIIIGYFVLGSYYDERIYKLKLQETKAKLQETKAKLQETKAKLQATIEWVSIPSGTFTMGSPADEVDRHADETQYQVTLSAFKMSKYEVTFEQYDLFCDATGRNKPDDEGCGRGMRPVVNVSWYDANEFAELMGFRLPTEAEWEYACRAGTKTPFNTGKNLTTKEANYDGNNPYNKNKKGEYRKRTMPVGSFSPNAWGLYDMHGNVSEWCSDWYGDYSTEAQTDPKGPESEIYHVFRGGSWGDYAKYCRSACRNKTYSCSNHIGFRLVLSHVNSGTSSFKVE